MPLQVPKCDTCYQSDVQTTCTICDANFCNECDKKFHIEKRKNHQRVPYTGVELPSRFCSIQGHEGQPLVLYCQTCFKPICALCCLHGDHKNHPHLQMTTAMEYAKQIIKGSLGQVQANITKIDQDIKVMEEEMKKLEEKIKTSKSRKIEETQKLEALRSSLNKIDVDPYVFLSLISELKLESKLGVDQVQELKLESKLGVVQGNLGAIIFHNQAQQRGLGSQQQFNPLRRLRVNSADFEQAWKKIEKDGGPIKKKQV